MSDLISRQAAIDALHEYFARIGNLKRRGLTKGEKAIGLDVVGALKTLPSAQTEPKTGKWLEDKSLDAFWICSVCRFPSEAFGADVLYNFCPNCGADMRGDVE